MLSRPLARRIFYTKYFIKKNWPLLAGSIIVLGLTISFMRGEIHAASENTLKIRSALFFNYKMPRYVRNFYEIPKFIELYLDHGSILDLTYSKNIGAYLSEVGIVLSHDDEIYPKKDFVLGVSTTAKIIRVEKDQYVVSEEISYKTKEIEDPGLELDKTIVEQKGEKGLCEKTYIKIFRDEALTETRLISEKIITPAVDEIVRIGTKKVPKTITINGVTITYYKKLWAWTTSYDSSCLGCSGTTATGVKVGYGIIAADPRVIPWHTKVYVPGYGFGKMEDTGGSLKKATDLGKIHVDLAFDNILTGWWSARYAWVYLLYEE